MSELRTELEHEHRVIDDGLEALATTDGRPDPLGIANGQRAVDLLRRHIYFEEESLFPPLRTLGLFGPVMVMIQEHAEMWPLLDALDRDLAAGADDSARLCRELLSLLAVHNLKEENILYAGVDAELPEAQLGALSAELGAAMLPAGWTCTGLQPRP